MGAVLGELQIDAKKAILEALEGYYGIVTDACKKVGISRQTFYEWLKNDLEFKAAVDDIQETAIDFVESKLFQKINGVQLGKYNDEGELTIYDQQPSDTAIIFYLKTKAKKRGYVERTEVSPVDNEGNNIQPVININVVRKEKQVDDNDNISGL